MGGCALDTSTFTFPELAAGDAERCTSQSHQTYGGGFRLIDGQVSVQCRNGGGNFWAGEYIEGGAGVLPYGSQITFRDMRCDSTEEGMACRSLTSGHGFRVSRSDYELF